MAALENDRPPLAAVLKNITHHIIARVVFIATCRLRSSPRNSPSSLGYTAAFSVSLFLSAVSFSRACASAGLLFASMPAEK